jgi:HK97 family phage major capsid protein
MLAILLQKQADAKAKARAIHTKATSEGRITTTEEDEQFRAHMAEANSYDAKIADARALLEADRIAPAVPAAGTGTPGVVVGHNNNEDKPWKTFAEQAKAVKAAALTPQRTDVRLLAAAAGGSEAVDGDGGFLIAPEVSSEVIKRTFNKAQLAGRCRGIPMASNRIVFPRANDASRADGQRNGGIQAFWTYEAAQYTKSKPTFGQLALQVDKLTALCVGTDELLEDAGAWLEYVNEGVADELSFKVDDAILNGPGVSGGPLGINNSGALIVIAEESSQAAATINYANLKKMYARMPGYLRGNAAWFVNQDAEPQLWDLTRGAGTAVELVYTPPGSRNNQSSFGTMFNMPVIPIEQAATLGTQGDIGLYALPQYMLGQRGGVRYDTSIHFYFDTGQQAFRFQMRVAGESSWDKPVTPKNGTATQSPFIQLATRA